MAGTVKVAYWDTAAGNPPRLFGQIKGTPTIKFIYPHKKNKKDSNKKKVISDYNGERKLAAMVDFAKSRMPHYISKINSEKELDTFIAKADKYALPKVLLFTKAKSTQAITKALSTEYRRRALVATIKLSKVNMGLIKKYKVNTKENNVLMVLKDGDAAPAIYDSKKFDFKKAVKFLAPHALAKPYYEDEAAQAKIAAAAAKAKAAEPEL